MAIFSCTPYTHAQKDIDSDDVLLFASSPTRFAQSQVGKGSTTYSLAALSYFGLWDINQSLIKYTRVSVVGAKVVRDERGSPEIVSNIHLR